MKKLNEEQKEYVRLLTDEGIQLGFRLGNKTLAYDIEGTIKEFHIEKGLLKEEFEVGKWYKQKNGECVWFSERIENAFWGTFLFGYGFHTNDGVWCNNDVSNVTATDFRIATNKEVSEALIRSLRSWK